MRVVRIDEDRALALCEDDAGRARRASRSASSTRSREGDLLLVHAGAALQHLGGAAG